MFGVIILITAFGIGGWIWYEEKTREASKESQNQPIETDNNKSQTPVALKEL